MTSLSDIGFIVSFINFYNSVKIDIYKSDNIFLVMRDMNTEFIFENPFLKAITISTTMAVFIIGIALGLKYMFSEGTIPMPLWTLLLIFAIIFIIGSVFFEQRGADQMGSLIGGSIVAVSTTFASVSFFGGMVYAFSGGIEALGVEPIISALAICMIASMLLIKLLSHKLQVQGF